MTLQKYKIKLSDIPFDCLSVEESGCRKVWEGLIGEHEGIRQPAHCGLRLTQRRNQLIFDVGISNCLQISLTVIS